MARTRSLKPGFFHDTRLTTLSPLTRILFAGIWCYSDRDGRIEDDPRQIKHDILPDDRCDVTKLLNDLAAGDRPFIFRYESGGRRYIQVRTWKKHQNPHQKEPASIIPAPENPVQAPDMSGACTEISGASRASSLEPSSLFPLPGTGSGNLESGTGQPPGPLATADFTESTPDEIAKSLVNTLIPKHWCLSNPRDAIVAAQQILMNATNPGAQAASIIATHSKHKLYLQTHPKERRRPPLQFWLSDGDYLHEIPDETATELPVSAKGW